MSMEELGCIKHVDTMLQLFLDESINDYILEGVDYGVIFKHTPQNKYIQPSWRYDGTIRLREKYSPMKVTLKIKDLYKWIEWRNFKLLPARWKWFTSQTIYENYGPLMCNDLQKMLHKKVISANVGILKL